MQHENKKVLYVCEVDFQVPDSALKGNRGSQIVGTDQRTTKLEEMGAS